MSDFMTAVLFGGFSLLLLLGTLFYFFRRRKREKAQEAIAIAEKEQRFQNYNSTLKKIPERDPFLPDANFYTRYPHDPRSGLQSMAMDLFEWLEIKPNGCVVDFYDEKDFVNAGADTAGFFTKVEDPDTKKVTEIILINSKYFNDGLAVGAVLAHEMTHLYLFRNRIKLEDTFENEQLTDLATIRSGLSVLILNGMSFKTQWWLSFLLIFVGVLYWKSEKRTFGYFTPEEYGQIASDNFKQQNIDVDKITSYLNPSSRKFFPHTLLKRHIPANSYIKRLENRRLVTRLLQGFVIILIFLWIIYSDSGSSTTSNSTYSPSHTTTTSSSTQGINNSYKNTLEQEINLCKSEVSDKEAEIETLRNDLTDIESRMSYYERNDNIYSYNSLVDEQNGLVDEIEYKTDQYDSMVDQCNALIDQYNRQ